MLFWGFSERYTECLHGRSEGNRRCWDDLTARWVDEWHHARGGICGSSACIAARNLASLNIAAWSSWKMVRRAHSPEYHCFMSMGDSQSWVLYKTLYWLWMARTPAQHKVTHGIKQGETILRFENWLLTKMTASVSWGVGIVDTGKFSFRCDASYSYFCITFRYLPVMGTREGIPCFLNALLDVVHGNIRLSTLRSTSARFQCLILTWYEGYFRPSGWHVAARIELIISEKTESMLWQGDERCFCSKHKHKLPENRAFWLSFRTCSMAQASCLCENGKIVLEPVAIVMRDCSNLWHLLKVQLVPYFMVLHDHGMDERSM